MKKLFYLIIPIIAFGLFSCRKSSDNFTIKQYDQNSIQNYISANGLTGMIRDTSGGDTTGIYYQVLEQGTGSVVDYPSLVSYVYSYHTFDNSYSTTDTINNHTNTYVGHVVPPAVQLSIKNLVKRKGTKIRLLIPSRLAFGTNGYFSGGVNINGNQCLDYSLYLVDNDPLLVAGKQVADGNGDIITSQTTYDDISLQKYMAANSLTGFTAATSKSGYKYYYKIRVAGTGTDPISISSTVGLQYAGSLLNGTIFDTETNLDGTAAATFTLYDVVDGFSDGLTHTTAGGQITLLLPSALGYGDGGSSAGSVAIPAFSCLRFDMTVISVSN